MKITLDIPDGIIAGFFNGVEVTAHGMQLDKIERETKLNPRHIHDLIDLLEIALEVL